MRESEYLKKQLQEYTNNGGDNDYHEMNYLKKIKRAERNERFMDNDLPKLKRKYNIISSHDKHTIETDEFGVIDLYPKANRLLIRDQNKWIGGGVGWVKKVL